MDAPSAELSAYIHWLKFGNTAAYVVLQGFLHCFLEDRTYYIVFGTLNFLAQVFSLSSLLICRKWLNIQPVTTNPLKLISSVLCYAARNKHSTERRSLSTKNAKLCAVQKFPAIW